MKTTPLSKLSLCWVSEEGAGLWGLTILLVCWGVGVLVVPGLWEKEAGPVTSCTEESLWRLWKSAVGQAAGRA